MEKEPQRLLIDISWLALLKLVALAAGLWAVFVLRDILFIIFVVFIFVAAVNPTIVFLQKYMSRTLAVVFFFVLILLAVMIISYLFIPRLAHQINELAVTAPSIFEDLRPKLESLTGQASTANSVIDQAKATFTNSLHTLSGNLLQTVISFFGGLATVLSALVLSFYLLLEEKNAKEFFHQVFPHNRYKAVYITVNKISERMGSWVRGQLLLMLIIAVANLISFSIIGIPAPLPLALWAGLTEAVPYIGPLLGVIPAAAAALAAGSPLKAILVVAVSLLVIQQLESNIAVPKIMEKVTGLSPVLVILAILIGVKLFGLIGAIIAIPIAAIISVVVGEWPHLRMIWQEPDKADDEEKDL